MIAPPETTMSAWVPGWWITQTGYALSRRDLLNHRRTNADDRSPARMHRTAIATQIIIDRIMQP